jgi:Asp-tRNA(Asn)/Glu-tRNA(Gln) amidotransferase C subunit
MPEFGMGGYSATAIPLSTIQELKGQGMSNNQIIQTLQRQGYTSTQIFDALSAAASQPPAIAASAAQGLNTPPQMRMGMDPISPASSLRSPPMGGSFGGSETEEMVEAIIDEKWNDLLSDINKVIAWKEATEARITKMEQQMNDLKESFDKLQQAVVGKVGEYDQHILEVGAEVKAMEKVFSKVLPVFTDNVAELSRVADQMKKNVQSQAPPGTLRKQ